MHDPPSVVSQNQEHVQNLEANRGHGEEVDGHHGLDVVLEECPPSLRGRLPTADHVLAHAGLADVDAEFEQFAMDARCSPEWILPAHLADPLPGFLGHRRAAGLAVADFPCPEQSEAVAVSGNDGVRLDDDKSGTPGAPNLAQPSPEESIGSGRFRPLRRSMQDAELVAQSEDLKLEGGTAAERPKKGREER